MSKINSYHNRIISQMLLSKIWIYWIFKQKSDVSLIALFCCIIHIENTCAPFSKANPRKSVMDTVIKIVPYTCKCYESSPVYGTVDRNRRQWSSVLCQCLLAELWNGFARIYCTVLLNQIQDVLKAKGILAKYAVIKDKNDSSIYIFPLVSHCTWIN